MRLFVSLSILLLWVLSPDTCCQPTAVITGRVIDAARNTPLAGATVSWEKKRGVVTSGNGRYLIDLPAGTITLAVKYLGYKPDERTVSLKAGDTLMVDFLLSLSEMLLDDIVVSGGKYEQALSELTISMEVIKPQRIMNTNTTSMEALMEQTPGITVLDGQANIRGGSGYSYGTGSRVLILMNGLPMLSADASDVKWDLLPVENIAQIEVIKGASSVLYGSSAMNGVINVRTAFPGLEPATQITTHAGFFMNPARKETIWWDRTRWFGGTSVSHSRKIGNLDLVAGANLFIDEGYRESETEKRARINADLRYRNSKVDGLSYGLRTTVMAVDKADFLLWQNADSGALKQNPESISELGGTRFHLDPFIEYQKKNGIRHSLQTRFFSVNNIFREATDKNNSFIQLYGEYKHQRKLGMWGTWISGISSAWSRITSNLYGDHTGGQGAIYTQVDGEALRNVNISVGLRLEGYRLDEASEISKPVFRAGMNYRLWKSTFLRMSFGQGYRFPSVAEKYAATSVGSLNIFPNPALESEKGWSAEAGIKQGFKIAGWNGYLDLAAFRMQYTNMIEFTFGVYNPDTVPPTLEWVGFKSLNIGNARITGLEATLTGEGNLFGLQTTITAGYSYIYPVDMDISRPDSTEHILKYRYRHSAKADAEFEYKRFSTGFSLVYNSFMVNVDEVFIDPFLGALILPGYREYREAHRKGYLVLDHRISYSPGRNIRLAVVTKNIFNKEYMGRPADIRPPRNITFQLSLNF